MKLIEINQRRALAIIIAAYLVLATGYSFVTPVFEAPDEVWHYAVVREIALHRQLPVSTADPAEPWAQEGLQSPLYYLLGAPLIAWMPSDALWREPARNPFARVGVPQFNSTDNNNVFLHIAPINFFDTATFAVHLLRLFSIVVGALTIVFTFLLAVEIFDDPAIALLAAVFVAFLPQFLFISGAISNDNLAACASAAALWFLARMHRAGFTTSRAIVLGIFVGAAMLSKVNTLVLVPLVLLTLFKLYFHDWRAGVRVAIIFLAVVALVSGWWFARNLYHYGDPFAIAPILAIVGENAVPLDFWRWLSSQGEGVRLSTWGVFGWMNVLAAPAFYFFYDALVTVGLISFVISVARARKISWNILIAMLWCGITFLALYRWASLTPASQGRLFFPALPAWVALWAKGISMLVPIRPSFVVGLLAGILATIAALVPVFVIAPAFTPQIVRAENLPAQPVARFADGVELLAVAKNRDTITAGESLDIALEYRWSDSTVPQTVGFVHLVNSSGVIVAQRDSFIGSGNWATLTPGLIVRDTLRLSIPITARAPEELHVQIGRYDFATGKRLHTDGVIEVGAVRLLPAQNWNFDFAGRAILLGAEFDPPVVAPGARVRVTLRWQIQATENLSAFVHVLGNDNQIWASVDQSLASQMQIDLTLAPNTPAGIFPLELGVYPASGERLPVFDAHGQLVDDRLFLGPLRVIAR
jgi:hypothetical protein